jgi:hypothetical protein
MTGSTETLADFDKEIVVNRAHSFLQSCARTMALCAETSIQEEMVRRFSEQVEHKVVRDFEPQSIPVLASRGLVKDMKLARDFREFAMHLPWRYSPRTLDKGAEMGIMDFRAMFDLGNVVSGLMYVDSHNSYPEHNHLPGEMYFLISGTAEWRHGGNPHYETLTAGNVVYNHPWNWHGVRAGHTPVLALYLLVL